MIIGVPKEIKDGEHRVSLTPIGAEMLVAQGHRVVLETAAGLAAGMPDDAYRQAGAEILADIREVYRQAEMIVKVKEPLESEYGLFHEGQILFTYLHLAPAPCSSTSPSTRAAPSRP